MSEILELGPTHYDWRPDVLAVVQRIESRFPALKANTYVAHPWPGWDGVSIDLWDRLGRGHAIDRDLGFTALRYALGLRRAPPLRHWIYLHTLWTSFGGESFWSPDDHSARLRHVHLTYWL